MKNLISLRPRLKETREAGSAEARQALRLVQTFEDANVGWFWECDSEGRITYLSAQIASKVHKNGKDVIGEHLSDVFQVDRESSTVERTINFQLLTRSAFSDYPVSSVAFSNGALWSMSGRPVFDPSGQFEGFVGSGIDFKEKREAQLEIARLAYFDPLTGLANRGRMTAWLSHALASRTSGFNPTALMLIDLDRFKAVNDTLGHQTGDELLKQVGERLQRKVGDAGIVGRIGGDEFQIILANDSARTEAIDLGRSIIEAVSQPYSIDGSPIVIGCSVGIAIGPEHGNSVNDLVRNADLALYAAKDAGRGVVSLYNAELLAAATYRKQIEDDLRDAITKGELFIAYQPIVSTQHEIIVGYEALLRWRHPVHGLISPEIFIPIAEDSGLIEAIGQWVIRTATLDASLWPESVRVAVNVSPVQFCNPNLASIVTHALAESQIHPSRLELEITEGVFLNDDEQSKQMFFTLKRLGVRLALDDFGTGYSSLSYLQSAPFDKIKIDKSFVRGAISANNRNAAIIMAIVTLANALGMETTAEGAENQDEIALIRDLGCSHIQGFVYGKPAPIAEIMATLSDMEAKISAIGHKVSRDPRSKTLRKATVQEGRSSAEVVVRNVSDHGAMIEGAAAAMLEVGTDIAISFLVGEQWIGNVRWVDSHRAGLHFERRLDPNLIVSAPFAAN